MPKSLVIDGIFSGLVNKLINSTTRFTGYCKDGLHKRKSYQYCKYQCSLNKTGVMNFDPVTLLFSLTKKDGYLLI